MCSSVKVDMQIEHNNNNAIMTRKRKEKEKETRLTGAEAKSRILAAKDIARET
jgi:hypothetical protein